MFPSPTTLSPQAQAVLQAAAGRPALPDPEPDDDQGWQTLGAIAAVTDPPTVEALAMATTGAVPTEVKASAGQARTGGATYYAATPEGHQAGDPRVLICIHGGSWTFGGGDTARRSTELIAANFGVRTWGIDYRQLPDHPFPAGLDDCFAVYRHLLETASAKDVAFIGQSAGANLAAALLLKARDEDLPLPGAVALISPPTDLRCAGDTYSTNGFTLQGSGLANAIGRYKGKGSLDHPYLSPLLGTYTADFPPVLLSAGTRDFLLSDTVRLHRRMLDGGVRAQLHVWEGAPHGMFGGHAPEDHEQIAQLREFFDQEWNHREPDSPVTAAGASQATACPKL